MSGFFVFNLRRRRGVLALALCAGLTLLLVHQANSAERSARLFSILSGYTIVIDPGHGGPDGGAVAPSGLLEKDVTLGVGLALRDLLTAAGATVVMTRERDEDISGLPDAGLRERWRAAHRRRVEIANRSGADVALSIHANAVPSPRWYGAQTFYSNASPVDAKALAEHIQRELKHITGGTEREASPHVEHFLLEHAAMPAVVVEVGFLSNPQEAELLARRDYQAKLAWAIFVGLAHYFHEQAALERQAPFAPEPEEGV